MKHLKPYESINVKLGDKVKFIRNKNAPFIDPEWYEVVEIDLPYWTDNIQYKISKLTTKGNKLDQTNWVERDEMITKMEIDAKKYNI